MVVSCHTCMKSCFSARNSNRLVVHCFLCDKKYNSKCFDLSSQPVLKILSSANNAVFMCHKCIERVAKMKQNYRRSDASNAVKSANDNGTQVDAINNDKATLSEVMTILQDMNGKFKKISDSNEELKLLMTNKHSNDETVNNNIDPPAVATPVQTSNGSSIIQQLHTRSIACKPKNKFARSVDPLNWSFTFNQSALPNDNVELYQLLNGFEQNTWTSFDYLRHKLDETTSIVQHIETICSDINSLNVQRRLESPVTDSIALDALHSIQDKCECIEKKVQALEASLKAVAFDSHIPSATSRYSTQAAPVVPDDNVSHDYNSSNSHSNSDTNDFTTQTLRNQLMQLSSCGGNQILNDQIVSLNTPANTPPINLLSASNNINSSTINIAPTSSTGTTQSTVLEAASPITNKLWFHVSHLKIGTTEEMVKSFIRGNKHFCQMDIAVKSLMRRDVDPSNITYASFKVGFDPSCAINIEELKSMWPSNISFSEFIPKNLQHQRRHRM